ncbi:flagellar basal body-associated FliL family protein [Nitratireductor aquimarinus]|uniref:flagellar basal body-associated FliL family protein n=1 Tax=Alphaproteobacteria TaxID=28211 RepID=UPI0019D39D8E|nr:MULTISPECIES: flagellar basal body-associated FliL family protein [Alphaproteobacteria]MBN7756732.1 flagellar basal body-associated FliL family protein [Nitratireductor aquimarinus]MBY5999652.1 flagellar basal body-associated FliL family protein [Tritonibacter mobilis]MBY6021677.1 flagellar basal body-associated FliL family protein [Nitratireductor sp. DP7N14-4]
MALLEQQPPESKGPSLVLQLAILLVMSALAGGAAWFAGSYLESRTAIEESGTAESEDAAHGNAGSEQAAVPGPVGVYTIEPITTNLAEPSEIWVRAEMALVFEGEPDPVIAEAVHQDLFAYLRTIKLRQVETASGFQHLRSDLEERARVRSDGAVKQILFRALLFE